MDTYNTHLFGQAALDLQERVGMRDRFEKMYANRWTDGLTDRFKDFVANCTTLYIASTVENGWPYVQHRGGPRGFLKVIEQDTLGFADYHGNQQFITQGNLATNDRVSLILMDYAAKARIKMIGHATMIAVEDAPNLAAKLSIKGEGPVERLTTIKVTALDVNCPKYINQRFDEGEIQTMLGPRITELARQVGVLSNRLKELGEDPAKLLKEDSP
jgi:predicted pyridoxine 5'-phosphate oxidase superfamily flavin-nucleotide-binding protein